MPTYVKVPLIALATAVSFLMLPVIGLPYGNFDWTAYSQPYQPPGAPPPGGACTYTVRYGDTLFSIARRFGVPVGQIARANSIRNINHIYVGQRLFIPNCRQQGPQCPSYVVRRGDTLTSIAYRFGTSVQTIVRQNGIRNPSRIFVGQRLVICPGHTGQFPAARYYVVRRGDTVSAIAYRFGTTPGAIIAANNLRYPWRIFPGQRLRIP